MWRRIEQGDLHGVRRASWTAQYTGDDWWLIRANELGYWLVHEHEPWAMTCEVFEIPDLMAILGGYIDKSVPNAESTCKQAGVG